MPSVPRRDPASIKELGPLPDVQVTGGATAETFGGGASQKALGTALEGLGTQEIKLAIAQQEGIDRTMANDLSNGMVKAKNDIQTEVAKNFQNAKAAEATDYIKKEWDSRVRPIIDSAPNERVKYLLNKTGAVHKNELDYFGMRHTVNEGDKYEKQTSKDYLAVKKIDAINNTLMTDASGQIVLDEEVTDRNIYEITNEHIRMADKYNIPRKGTEQETAVFNAGLNNDIKEMYLGQINQAISQEQYTLADQIFKKADKFIVGDDALRVKNLLTREVSNKTIESNADALVALGEDPVAVSKGFDTIPLAQRSATKAEYERKMEQWGTVWNENAATVAVQISSKSLTKPVDLERYAEGKTIENGLSKDFYRLAQQVLDKNIKFETDKGRSSKQRQSLTEEYGKTYDPNPIVRDQKMAAFRNNVFANKTKLTESDFDALINISGYKVMKATADHPDMTPYLQAIKTTSNMAFWTNPILSQATNYFVDKAINSKASEVKKLYKETVEKYSVLSNSMQANLEGTTNYEGADGKDLRAVNGLESDAKNDFTLHPGDVLVRIKKGPDKGRMAKILRKNYKSEWFELA